MSLFMSKMERDYSLFLEDILKVLKSEKKTEKNQ